jgi:drug/metabolite transporter (DMT)-like permease
MLAQIVGIQSRTEVPALVAGLVTVTLWGSSFVAIRDAGQHLSPGTVALGRLLVSVAVLSVVATIRRQPLPPRRDLVPIAAFGVLFLGVYSVILNAAERRVDAGTAAMLINTGPILIAIGAGVFLKEGFPRRLFAGCAVAFTGCLLIGLANSRTGARAGAGVGLLLVAACAYAAAPTAVGFATWAYALRRMSAGRLASLAYLIPVVAILLGWALLDETPPWPAIAGGALCVTGVYLARGPGSRP